MKKKTAINEMMGKIQGTRINAPKKERRLTLESMIYDDENHDMGIETDFEETDEFATEPATSDTTGIIRKIRVEVLKGLAALAEHPESDDYDTLKRILTICDKPAEKSSQKQVKNA